MPTTSDKQHQPHKNGHKEDPPKLVKPVRLAKEINKQPGSMVHYRYTGILSSIPDEDPCLIVHIP